MIFAGPAELDLAAGQPIIAGTMATYFEKASDDQLALLRAIIDEHHPELAEAGVTVALLEARAETDEEGDPKGPAITVGGYPAIGSCQVTPYLGRVQGLADALIKIDALWWEDADDQERSALLDHEVMHLQLKEGDERDRAGRPRLKLRKHDRQHGWFDAIARRWGPASQEHQQCKALLGADLLRDYQLPLPGLAAVEPIEEKPAKAAAGG